MKPLTNTFEVQQGKLGKPFYLIMTKKGDNEKWVDRILKSDWYHIFKYTDGSGMFGLYEDVYGNIAKKLDHQEVNDLLWS